MNILVVYTVDQGKPAHFQGDFSIRRFLTGIGQN